MDYGQPLLFGSSITPLNGSAPFGDAAGDPLVPVRLAQRSEELGLDLVTVQDHPYQPRFHETWTLLSWIAGATERIRLSPNVLNVPMRPPAVVARAAASLDLLSEGRVELALGAGAFWDAMTAMGASRLSPGESVTALEEAIEIFRGVWDLSRSTPLHVRGEHHRVTGADRGPAPAHRIPLHIGAGKARMLDLIGREADGWVLPGGPAGLGMLADGNAVIDDAARSMGRSPREVRRILNLSGRFRDGGGSSLFDGPWEQWVEQLVPLMLDGGISTVLLSGDDESALETFATRVVPAVREAVAEHRDARGTDIGPIVPLSVRARRRSGIAYDKLPASLAEVAVEPGDVGYGAAKSTYLRGGTPGIVLRPRSASDVSAAVTWARQQSVELSVRSGGHGFSGRSTNDGGVVIDLSRMHGITVLDEQARRVRIEPGARWGDVAAALRPHGWAISSGDSGGVGVGGLATAGGVGYLSRAHGLTIDHVRAVELVLADGSQIRASEDQHPELFWGMRGAGFAFGIVTAFEFEADVVGDIGFGQLQHDVAGDIAGFLVRWGAAVEASPRDTTSFLIMGGQQGGGMIAQTMNVIDSDDPDTVLERLQRLADVAPLVGQQAMLMTYDSLVTAGPRTGHSGYGEPTGRSGLLEHITPAFAADAEQLLTRGATSFFQIRALGGATTDVASDATAFAHRSAQFSVLAMSSSPDRIDPIWDAMRRHFTGLYLSFETDQDPARLHDAFPPETLERLRALKRQYDPDNVFHDNFDLDPERPAA
ncbi:LLM class flavin-dependent oxidoreductase [Microbacterium sp. H1-D42]|uniref:LLM class flavin-dependent oxidoreductase n=1 Tax=Microbacterium sp. H1-D42 TaxID=2925844 RepID=UPI001F5373AC|nr:LLM class flavin-dependent oxidoreductase [Microbacterium sp. H1-D42]UNK71348.1 LLM class flavin-dependent oxidoreductase [Microbacterium sp. H1-D42]